MIPAKRRSDGSILEPAKTIRTFDFAGREEWISKKEWVRRMACSLGGYYSLKNFAVSREVGLPEFRQHHWGDKTFTYTVSRQRADFIAINKRGETVIVETKTCWADFAADHKWQAYLPHCHKFYFAADTKTAEKIAERLAQEPGAEGVGVIAIALGDEVRDMTFLRPAKKHEQTTPVQILLWQMAARSSGFAYGVNNGSIFC